MVIDSKLQPIGCAVIEEGAIEEERDETMGSPHSVSGAWNAMDDWLGVQASVADSTLPPTASPDSLGERDHPSAGAPQGCRLSLVVAHGASA